MFKKQYVLMADANAGDEGGSGAGAPSPAPAPASSPSPAPAPAPAGSIISQGQTPEEIAAATAAAEAAKTQNSWVPEKYQVKKQDGTLDIEASAKKQAEAFKALETRLGTGDIPPKTADEYTFAVPDALKDQWKPEEDEQFLDFKKEAHKLGFTQKQFEYAVNRHLETLGEVGMGQNELSADEAINKLHSIWPDEQSFGKNMNASFRALRAYANPGTNEVLGSFVNMERKFGNDPDFIAFMANIGKETAEDMPPIGSILPDATVESLQNSKAYWDPTDPAHAETKAKVEAHFARKYPAKQ